jgi:hypothetical protein
MALFRRSKSPFAYEIDRFHAPQPPLPEFVPMPKHGGLKERPSWSLKGRWFNRASSAETPVAAKDEPVGEPLATPEPDEPKTPARRRPNRNWLRGERAKGLVLPGDELIEAAVAAEPRKAVGSQDEKAGGLRQAKVAKPQSGKGAKPQNGKAAGSQPGNATARPLKEPKPAARPYKPQWSAPEKPVAHPAKADLTAKAIRSQPPTAQRRWFERNKPIGSSQAAKEGTRSSDLTIAALGITLGLICALFPWYIFFNQEKFGVRAMKFEGGGVTPSTQSVAEGPPPQRVGAPMSVENLPSMQLDLLATGTLPDKRGESDSPSAPGLDEQPFPVDIPQFKLVHVANNRAMIEDDAGLWIVQVGSTLPDSSQVESIEKRGGKWVLVTSGNRIVGLTP